VKGERLGELEELAVLAVLALQPGAYGIAVQQVIEEETGREVSLGAVYAALERMERKGLLRSALGESTPERGGKRRRLFEATAAGVRMVHEVRRAREALWNIVPRTARRPS
jgi:DNA-binding PadR family transcriptional regulator